MNKEIKNIVCDKCSHCKMYQLLKCDGVDNDIPFYCMDYDSVDKEDVK